MPTVALTANVPKEVMRDLSVSQPTKCYDFVIQNNSGSDVYFLDSTSQTTADGLKIASGSYLSKDNWTYAVVLLCTSNVNVFVTYQTHLVPWKVY